MGKIILFGASGDLAGRYIIPAINKLRQSRSDIELIGFGRSVVVWTKDKYIVGNYDKDGIASLAGEYKPGVVYYVSLPIRVEILISLIEGLAANKILNKEDKIVLEKPFGSDFLSAKNLIDVLKEYLDEEQIYFVDHYLSKDLVRNISTLRFANPVLQAIWKKELVESIEIVAQEEVGVETRGEYYDRSGAVRDMVQNHLLQILALICLNKPEELSGESFAREKIKVLNKLETVSVKLGQYRGYKNEIKVDPSSITETKAEIEFRIKNADWEGVPIWVKTGKKMGQKKTYVAIKFKKEHFCIWGDECVLLPNNELIISIYPENEVQMVINSSFDPHQVLPKAEKMRLSALTIGPVHEAYENVIAAILSGDRLYTPTTEEILAQWRVSDEILAKYGGKIEEY